MRLPLGHQPRRRHPKIHRGDAAAGGRARRVPKTKNRTQIRRQQPKNPPGPKCLRPSARSTADLSLAAGGYGPPSRLSFHAKQLLHARAGRPGPAQGQAVGFRGNRLTTSRAKSSTKGGRRVFPFDDARRDRRPRQLAQRGDRLPHARARGRRNPPKGTIYFVENDDIRSKVRHDLFPAAVRELKQIGVAAEILEGTRPVEQERRARRGDGHGRFRLEASGSAILPGNLRTLHQLRRRNEHNRDQTPLSEFLRYGAAAASGTVTEPYAIADKFPSPMIQVYYARGCTAGRGVLSVGVRPLPVADRGRSALPALGGHSAGLGGRS